jgi:uncharacterized protein YcaQ
LKSNRQEKTLQVKSSWAEEGAKKFPVPAVAKHLRQIAKWQGLNSIEVANKGNVALELSTDFL